MSVHFNSLGRLGLGPLSFPRPFFDSRNQILPSHSDCCGAGSRSGVVHHLVGQGDRGAVREDRWLLPPLQEKGQQFSFPFHKDGPSPHKAEAVLPKDGLCFFHHLWRENIVSSDHSCPEGVHTWPAGPSQPAWNAPLHTLGQVPYLRASRTRLDRDGMQGCWDLFLSWGQCSLSLEDSLRSPV